MTLAGYFPKITAIPAGFELPPHVEEICGVSHCVGGAPEKWIDHWLHNEAMALQQPSRRPHRGRERPRFEILGYRILAASFIDGRGCHGPPARSKRWTCQTAMFQSALTL